MSSFDEYRKKLTGKYGSKPKKTEDEQEKKPTAIDGSSVWDDSFESTRKEMTARYGGGVDFSKVKEWFTESDSILKNMSEYYTANDGKWVSNYGGDFTEKIDELLNLSSAVGYYLRNNKKEFSDYDSVSKALSEYRSALEQYQKQNSSLSQFYSQFGSEDEYNSWYEWYKKEQEYQKYFENVDPTKASQGFEKYLSDEYAAANVLKHDLDNDGKEAWWEKALGYLAGDGGGVVDTTLPTAGVTQTIHDLRADESYRRPGDDWSEEQKNAFGQLYGISPSLAYDFAEETNRRNKNAAEEEALKKIAESATSDFWAGLGHTFGAIVTAPFGLVDTLSDLAMWAAGRPIESDGFVSPFEYSQAVTSGISTHLNEKSGTLNENIPIIGGKGLGDVYGLVTSIAQSMASAYTLGSAGTLISYFGQGAASGIDDALSRGASDGQAVLYGISLGVFEGLAEMAGVDNLFKLGASSTVKGFITNILKQAGAEGIEEGLTSLLSNIADNAIMQDKSNFNSLVKQYMAQGMSESDAKKKAWMDSVEGIAFDTIAGAVSGGVSGGVHTTLQTIKSNANAKKIYGADSKALVDEALEIDAENEYAKEMKERLDSGKKLSGYQLNRLVEANEQALRKQAQDTDNKSIYDLASEQAGVAVATEEDSVGKNPTEKENATEAKFGVSTDGKTRIGDLEVSIKEIASVKDGEVTLRLEDGSTVNAMDVEFGSPEEMRLYDSVASMNLNAASANAFINGYDHSMDVQEYALGFREAYRYGEYGFPVKEMSTKGFSANLSEAQRTLAYDLGKTDTKYKIEARQNAIAEKSSEVAPKKVGKVHYAEGINMESLTQRQQASLKGLESLATALGVEIHIFESQVVDGKRQGANGWFDRKDGSIHLDLHAGLNGEGTMLFTASHELTHFIREWNPSKFKVFADSLLEEYGNKGVSVETLVSEQIAKAKRNGRDISYDTAYEEVIADSCEAMLADGDIIGKIAKLKAKDKSLWEKIKDFITALVAKIKAAYEGMTPDSVEGRFVSEMLDKMEKLKALWTDALVEASDNYTSAEKTLFDNGIVVDSETESASLMSVRDLLNSEQQQKVAKTLAERFDVTVEEAKGWISAETSLASLILNPKYSQYLDYEADPNEEAVKSNSDYPQGTVDFSNICKKRRDFTEVMNRVLRNFPNHVFEATDLAKIRTIMSEEGMEVACGICYVEDRRQLDSIVAQDFIDSLALYRQGSTTRPDGKAFNANQLKALKMIDGDSYTPSIYELISLEGRNSLKAKNPAMEEAWVKYNNARGMQSVRLLLNDAEYKRQILDYKPSVVKRKNDLGGLRIYSFSDMEMFHLIDVIQVITDSATVGLSIQGYTKVNEYAKAVKDTGEKLNRSLIPKGDLGYHMENGRIVLDYDTVEGIDVNHPDFFDNIDNPNIGNIVIGINAKQIRAAMTSKFIDQIIPFHTGQSNEVLGEKGIATWVNYKDFQSERDLSTGKKSSHQINIYTEVIQAAEAEGKPITNKVDFVNKFLEVCKENNLEPRFSEFLNVDENGDYVYTEGYHKFLVDFKTFDQNTGEYLPQKPVKPIFDNEYMTQLLKDYVKTQAKKDADFTKAAPKVLDRITNEIVNSKDKLLSDRDSYAPTFYSYMGKVVDGIKSEKVGANGVVPYLKGKGVKAEEIKWSGIEGFLEGKKSVTKEELQEFVAGSQLQIVEQVSGEDIDLRYDGSKRAYNLYDSNGKVVDTFTYNEFLGGYVAESDEEIYSNHIELTEALREAYGVTSAPKWADHKIDGGTNYRELVFQLPDSSYSNRAMRVHWGQDAEGVLAHARIQDFDVNGKKMLFVEEIQSDWHNEGHQKGYSTEEYEDAVAVYDKLAEDYANKKRAFNKYVRSGEFRSDPDEVSKKKFDWLRRKMDEAEKRMQSAERDIEALKKKGMGDVPDAPFRNNYHEYVLKRLLRMAAEEGYDSIGWTPSEIQSMRWSDEFAEGYRIEYDQDIPSFLKKYGKKWGATVGKTQMPSYEPRATYYDVNRQQEYGSFIEWQNDVERELKAQGANMRNLKYESDDNYWIAYDKVSGTEWDRAEIRRQSGSVWSMDIPDSMKDSVLYEGQVLYSDRYQAADTNTDILSMVEKVGNGNFKANEKVDLGIVSDTTAAEIQNITGINVKGFKVAIEARQIEHILKDHGKNGTTDRSMANPSDIAKIEFALEDYDDIRPAGKTQAYSHMVNGRNRTADTVLYEKAIGEKAYYVVQAVPNTKAKTLYIVTAFIGKKGYKKEASQLINAKSPDATSEIGSADTSNNIISQPDDFVKREFSDRDTDSVSNRSLLANALESVAQNDIERGKLKQYKEKIALIESEQAKLAEIRAKIKELSFAKGARDTQAIKSLQFEANQTANRINTYDKQLLNLESTKALKDVLQREKEMAYKRAEKRGKEALSAYREKAAKTQRELMTRYQESRKKNVEGRKQTAMRHKIKDVVSELNQYLLKGTKDKHVPIELQKAVAEALDAVNMDTVGAEERIAKLESELMKAKTPEAIKEISRKIDHIREMGERMDGKLQSLKNAYDDIVNSNDPLIANSHDEVISNTIDKVIKEVGSTPLRDMTLAQLESVYDMYKMVLTTIRNTNKAFKAAKSEEISVIANRVMEEIDGLGKKKPYRTKVSQALSKFDWNNLKPVYAFDRIGSNTFTEVFNNVRAGEDTWAVDITEAKNFSLDQRKKFKYDSWDFKKRYGFTSSSGMHFELSLDQIMSIYAYSKREQAKDHLKKGGIVIDETTEVTVKNKLGIPVKFNPTEATAYNLSDETLAAIIGKLTTEQMAFVDVMQDYLSTTMGDKGNEVSLALYGIKLYKEKNYFPLKSAQQFMAKAKEQQKGEVKIKNSGFSKETVTKASNPIVLTPFMDVWADHVNEMSMYHAFVLPLEDFYRVYNYKTPTSDTMATESVEMFLQNSYGKGATQYIDQLLKDLNGGARVDPTAGIINKLTGLFKKSAVFASLSVVVQQPSAIARATALVDTKYFAGIPSGKHSETWAEVKKYAPVAVIKEMGYFDTGMGQSTVEWIKDEKTWKDKLDDIASKAPALADELAWCSIWKAVKRETLNTHKDLKPNSEEFLKAVGERFTEVVTKTQVYDSVLSRSANMRSKDTGMKMATAFMGEPTTSINMLENALIQGKRGNKRYACKAVGSVVASMILNSILVSFVYAGRDDDEEKTYTEKYIGTLTEELIDSFNPLTLIPFVKDIVSIAQGYDVERSDMAVITDIVKAWNNLENDNRSVYRKVEDFAGAIASLLGLPVKNIMRDARGIYNTVNSFINGEKTTGAGIGEAVKEAVTGKEKSNGQLLYDAIVSGNTEQANRVKSRFEDQKAIDSAIRKALRDNDSRIKQAAEARYNGDIAGYMRIAKEIIAEGNFSQDNIVSAINSEINALKKGEGTSESTTSNKVKSIYEMSDYYSALEGRDQATAYVVKEDLIKTDMANGKEREEAEADFNSKFASHLRDLYEKGDISDSKAEDMLVSYGGKSEEEAFSKVQYWEFRKQYPDYDLSEEAVTKYYNDVEPSGIGIDVYYDYSKQRAKCKGTDSDGDGKTDSGSVKSEVLYIIDSLPITNAQKDVLYYLNGWAQSTIRQAPWH